MRRPRTRLLSIAALTAGLLAVSAGAAGLVVHGLPHPAALRLVGKPSIVAVPRQTAEAPGGLSAAQTPAAPVELTIPAIGVRNSVVNLGLQPNGSLQVPLSTGVVGWYTGSPRPGAVGSSVLAGHVDSESGPGVFYWLSALRAGDRVLRPPRGWHHGGLQRHKGADLSQGRVPDGRGIRRNAGSGAAPHHVRGYVRLGLRPLSQ